jgi:hypothetical protein
VSCDGPTRSSSGPRLSSGRSSTANTVVAFIDANCDDIVEGSKFGSRVHLQRPSRCGPAGGSEHVLRREVPTTLGPRPP